MSATTYFGDVVTTGNTNIVQNFVTYGASSRFTSNILGSKSIGTPGAPFGNVFVISSNNATMNTSTFRTPTAFLSGNVVASNAHQSGNLFTTLMNVTGVSNTFSLVVNNSNVGIGTTGGANLMVQGSTYFSNLTTTNVSAGLLNVYGIINTGALFVSSNTGPGGANLNAIGNVWVSNSILTNNLYTTSIKASVINTATLTSTGLTVGTAGSTGSFTITGNVYVSNSLTTGMVFATNVYATTANIVGTINASSVYITQDSNGYTYNTSTINTVSISECPFFLKQPAQTWSNVLVLQNSNYKTGWATALSGTAATALIGSPGEGGLYGSVAVYRNVNGNWSLQAGLQHPGGSGFSQPRFGSAVALSGDGNIACACAYNFSFGQGFAGVYRYTNGSWSGFTTLARSINSAGFGWCCAMSSDGNVVVVGTRTGDHAAVYRWNGSSWVRTLLTVGASGFFGRAVALSNDGNTAVIGAPIANVYGGWAGVYTYSGGAWTTTPKVLNVLTTGQSNFGTSVAITPTASTIVVGAAGYFGTPQFGTLTGNVAVYNNVAGEWDTGTLLPYTPPLYTCFGQAVGITPDSSTIFVGSAYQYAGGGPNVFRIFRYLNNQWDSGSILLTVPQGSGGAIAQDLLVSISVAANGGRMILGSSAYGYTVFYAAGSTAYSTLGVTVNVFVSNSLTGSNLSVTNQIYYNEDLTKRSIYLSPSPTNASVIQSAISATCNASIASYWCTSPAPVYANIVSGSSSSNAYSGGVLVPDGRVVFVTSNCSNVSIFNPSDFSLTRITGARPGFNGGLLLPNGNVLFVPQVSNVCQFNPVTSVFSNIGSLPSTRYNGVLGPDGVWLTPQSYSSSPLPNVSIYNYNTGITSNVFQPEQIVQTKYNNGSLLLPSGNVLFSPVGSSNVMEYRPFSTPSNIVIGTDKFNGLVLAPNGNVITVPSGSNICVIDLVGRRSTNVGPITGPSASNFFNGGALLPSGNIVFAPGTSGNVGMFDPVALTYSNSVSTGTSGLAFSGATLLPSGQVVFTPSESANVGILDTLIAVSPEFCLSPYFNKF
jgi:hypothetical protein